MRLISRYIPGILIVTFIFVASSLYTSCKRGGDDPPPSVPPTPTSSAQTFSQVYTILNQAGCLASNCHGGSQTPVMNTQANAYSNLVGKTSNCNGKVYVAVSNVASSYLIEKIASNPQCGTRMPTGNTGYFDTNSSQLDTIKVWINAGAQNN